MDRFPPYEAPVEERDTETISALLNFSSPNRMISLEVSDGEPQQRFLAPTESLGFSGETGETDEFKCFGAAQPKDTNSSPFSCPVFENRDESRGRHTKVAALLQDG